MNGIQYRKGYKYQLAADYVISLPIPYSGMDIVTDFVTVSGTGIMRIRRGYAWDGPSGPTIDTSNAMRASLVHDAMYQLIRLGYYPHRYQTLADDIFHRLLIEDGMTTIRAALWRKALGWFGRRNARPSREKPIMMAP